MLLRERQLIYRTPLYRRAKVAAGQRGIKLREIFAEALERHLSTESDSATAESHSARRMPPKVTASELAKYPDAGALRRAFPNGYRIVGPKGDRVPAVRT